MEHILCLFSELHENFFPIAHTQAPLDDLIIINGRKSQKLLAFQEHCIARLREETKASITGLKMISEKMPKVLNPKTI